MSLLSEHSFEMRFVQKSRMSEPPSIDQLSSHDPSMLASEMKIVSCKGKH